MAFDFGSDILVDAMRAADPARVAEAKARLEQLSSQSKAQSTSSTEFKASTTFGRSLGSSVQSKPGSDPDVMQKFEAVVLSTFVQAMMPKNAESIFGKGLAGDMWKAQMAEKIATQLSESGGIGIASRLLSDYQRVGDQIKPISGLRDPAAAVEQTRAEDAASQLLKKIELNQLLQSKSAESDKSMILRTAKSLSDV